MQRMRERYLGFLGEAELPTVDGEPVDATSARELAPFLEASAGRPRSPVQASEAGEGGRACRRGPKRGPLQPANGLRTCDLALRLPLQP